MLRANTSSRMSWKCHSLPTPVTEGLQQPMARQLVAAGETDSPLMVHHTGGFKSYLSPRVDGSNPSSINSPQELTAACMKHPPVLLCVSSTRWRPKRTSDRFLQHKDASEPPCSPQRKRSEWKVQFLCQTESQVILTDQYHRRHDVVSSCRFHFCEVSGLPGCAASTEACWEFPEVCELKDGFCWEQGKVKGHWFASVRVFALEEWDPVPLVFAQSHRESPEKKSSEEDSDSPSRPKNKNSQNASGGDRPDDLNRCDRRSSVRRVEGNNRGRVSTPRQKKPNQQKLMEPSE